MLEAGDWFRYGPNYYSVILMDVDTSHTRINVSVVYGYMTSLEQAKASIDWGSSFEISRCSMTFLGCLVLSIIFNCY